MTVVALPVIPAVAYSASTLATEINDQGGDVTQVFWWNAAGGTWYFFLADLQYGNDFDIELGKGYLLKKYSAVTWAIQGN